MAEQDYIITYRWVLNDIEGQFYIDEFCSLTSGFTRWGPIESRSLAECYLAKRKAQLEELRARILRCKDTHAQCGRYTEENVDVVFV